MSIDIIIHIMAMMHKVNYFNSFEKKLKSVGKKLNKKDLLSTNIATKHCYCTQLCYMNTFSTHIKPWIENKNTER